MLFQLFSLVYNSGISGFQFSKIDPISHLLSSWISTFIATWFAVLDYLVPKEVLSWYEVPMTGWFLAGAYLSLVLILSWLRLSISMPNFKITRRARIDALLLSWASQRSSTKAISVFERLTMPRSDSWLEKGPDNMLLPRSSEARTQQSSQHPSLKRES